MRDAALEELRPFIAPMLAASTGPAPTEAGWALEVKWDGDLCSWSTTAWRHR